MSTFREWLFGSQRVERETPEEDIGLASEASWSSQISAFWGGLQGLGFSSSMVERVWAAERCQHMVASAVASMPLRFYGSREPAWVANPDPVWFPNGIRDAVYAMVDAQYRWGDAFLHVTSRYASGFPSGFTVLDSSKMTVGVENGRRSFRYGQLPLDPENVIQISRNPRANSLNGTSALSSGSSYAHSLIAAADLGRVMMGTGTPTSVLKSQKKLTPAQAQQLQSDWMTATSTRRGAPAVLPPEIDFDQLQFSPRDMMLMEVQQFDAQLIAGLYGLPAVMLNMPIEGGLNYQTPLLAVEQWWRVELRPTALRTASALGAAMLPAGSWVEFDEQEFVAPTFDDNAKTWVELVGAGVVSAEEARAALLGARPSDPEKAIEELLTPPSAGASPTQQSSSVIALRPTKAVST